MKQPKTLREALVHFSNEENARKTAIELIWPDGKIRCPHCGFHQHWYLERQERWKCKGCRKPFSIKTGTLMEDSRLSLGTWMSAIWMFASARNGISAREISRTLGIGRKAAWFLLHRIRTALKTGTFKKLSGTVEVDETFVGGARKNMHKKKRDTLPKGRGGVGKAIVLGMRERDGAVVTKVIQDTSSKTLHAEIKATIEKDSNVYTDNFSSYNGIEKNYVHETVDHSAGEYVRGDVHTNSVENLWSLFKRFNRGTYTAVSSKHLQRYTDEQAFRHTVKELPDNERVHKIVAGLPGKRLTYQELIRTTGDEHGKENSKAQPSERRDRKAD